MGRISTISQKSSSQVTMTGRVSLFGSTLQTYRNREKIETRLAGSSFIKRSMRASFSVIGIILKRKNGAKNPSPSRLSLLVLGRR
jgi:hypothetical protein